MTTTKNLIIILFLSTAGCANAQKKDFKEFVKKFPEMKFPIDSISALKSALEITPQEANYFVWQHEKTKKDQKLKFYKKDELLVDNSVGTVDTFPTRYMDLNGKEGDFYSKVYAIGKVNLDPNYINLIMKTFSSETSFYEIYSFTKTGKCLSVICLFLYYNKRLRLDEIDFVRISSKILADKTIHWIEKGHGVEILRVYRLRPDGYFEITQENQKGEFEY